MKNIIILFICCFCISLNAQTSEQTSPIVFIYDASGSMWGEMEQSTKVQIASSVLGDVVDDLPDDQPMGLVAYGHRRKGDCSDVETLVNIGSTDQAAVIEAIAGIKPLGRTPLAASAEAVIEQLRAMKQAATIILLTDGIESCSGNICDVIRAAKAEGIDLILHVVGFGIAGEDTEQLRCAAAAGDGRYFDAGNQEGLVSVLRQATRHTVDIGIGNLAVFTIKNKKPIDAYIKVYDENNKDDVLYTDRTYGDTAKLMVPAGKYALEIEALEQTDLKAIVVENVHVVGDGQVTEIVSFDAGTLVVSATNNREGWDAVVSVHDSKTGKAVTQGRTYARADNYELDPGVYDVVIKALAVNGVEIEHRIEGVEISGGQEHELSHDFKSGELWVGTKSQEDLVDAVVSVYHKDQSSAVAQGRTYKSDSSNPKKFVLNPGVYRVVVKAVGDYKGESQTVELEIRAGEITEETITFKVQ